MGNEERKREYTEQPPSPPQVPFFEWQSFASSIITTITILLAVAIPVLAAARKMGSRVKRFLKMLLNEEENQEKALNKYITENLQSLTTKIQLYSGCDRALLGGFHNGEYYKSGLSRDRYSIITEEPANSGIQLLKREIQDIPFAAREKEYKFLEEDRYVFADTKANKIKVGKHEYPLPDNWRNRLLRAGAAYGYDIGIYKDHFVVAMLTLHYSENNRANLETFKNNFESINNLIYRIEATLTNC